MRLYARTPPDESGNRTWVTVETDAEGRNDELYLIWLVQVLRLNYGESPFWGDWGLPAAAAVASQTQPDYYVQLTQSRFAKFFASLILTKIPQPINRPTPTYRIDILTKSGYRFPSMLVELPT